jgi:ATP-dependent DNA ligase
LTARHNVAVALPQSLVPMQLMLGKPFHRAGWVDEEKYDGWRIASSMASRRSSCRLRWFGSPASDRLPILYVS